MNPDALSLWRGPRWALALLLAGLGMLGPFSIDTYLPAFAAIAASLDATAVGLQQTLSAFLVGFAAMNLFHGALSDSVGRRPVILWGIAVYALASAGCALSPGIGWLVFFRLVQGLASGAGMVVSRTVIRDLYPPEEAQRVMAQVTLFFGIAPAVAPLAGGLLVVHVSWQSIFWALAGIGAVLLAATWRWLPETLHATQRQPFSVAHLLRGYAVLGTDRRLLALAVASGVPFNGMFIYVMSAPVFLGEHLGLAPTRYFWLFLLVIGGIMAGAWCSGRLAGRMPAARQIGLGFAVMGAIGALNVALALALPPSPAWSLPPLAVHSFGWALMVPVATLMVLDLVPARRGMASSLHAFAGGMFNAFVAGVVSPWVMHSTAALAAASLGTTLVGLAAWLWVRPRLAATA